MCACAPTSEAAPAAPADKQYPQTAIIHGNLEKRSLGKSWARKASGFASWKLRYIVVFPTEVRWYEGAHALAVPNRCLLWLMLGATQRVLCVV